jgi:hypothetical protein
MEAFSTNDVYYIKATAPAPDSSEPSNEETAYKENVDKLNGLKESYQLTQKQNGDLNTSQNALILNNVTLGVGIFAMMLIVYNK